MSDQPPASPAGETPPFTRGRIQWSRPPQTIFRAGPLPKGPVAPRPPAAASILSGSMIPRAGATEPARPEPAAFESAMDAPSPPEPPVAASEPIAPDPAPAPEPEPEPEPEAFEPPPPLPPEIEVAAEPIEAVQPAPSPFEPDEIQAAAMPSVVVTRMRREGGVSSAAEAPVARGPERWLIAAGVGVVVVIAGFIWLATLPSGEGPSLDSSAPPPAASSPSEPATEASPPTPTQGDLPASVARPQPLAPRAAPPPAQSASPPSRSGDNAPAPARAAPERAAPRPAPVETPPVESVPRPYIEPAPLEPAPSPEPGPEG